MNRNEQIRILRIGNGGPLFQAEIGVLAARHDGVALQLFVDHFLQPSCDLQDDLFLMDPFQAARRTVVLAAVSSIDNDPPNTQSQLFGNGAGLDFFSVFHRYERSSLLLCFLRRLGFYPPYVQDHPERVLQ